MDPYPRRLDGACQIDPKVPHTRGHAHGSAAETLHPAREPARPRDGNPDHQDKDGGNAAESDTRRHIAWMVDRRGPEGHRGKEREEAEAKQTVEEHRCR